MSITVPAYLKAWETYHLHGAPMHSWNDAMSAHLHHGVVVSTPDLFLMARRVNYADADHVHLSPLQWREGGDCWNIWLAVGRLESLLQWAQAYPTPWVSYCRGDSIRLRRRATHHFFRSHGIDVQEAFHAGPAAGSAAAGVVQRRGENRRRS